MNPAKKPEPSLQEFYYVTYEKETRRELYEKQYKLIKVLSGKARLSGSRSGVIVPKGYYVFVNQGGFSRIQMTPDANAPFKMICLNFTDEFMEKYRAKHSFNIESSRLGRPFEVMKGSIQLDTLFLPLQTYIKKEYTPDPVILHLKLEEAIRVLEMECSSAFFSMIHSIPPKGIDLREFIERNYHINAPLEQFAKLSGRSLSSFRREFEAMYGEKPAKWMMNRRLAEAYDLIQYFGHRPVEVYSDVGFESLAHFSRKFKERYGITPSELTQRVIERARKYNKRK